MGKKRKAITNHEERATSNYFSKEGGILAKSPTLIPFF